MMSIISLAINGTEGVVSGMSIDKVLFNELISILDFNIDLEQVKDNLSENARK